MPSPDFRLGSPPHGGRGSDDARSTGCGSRASSSLIGLGAPRARRRSGWSSTSSKDPTEFIKVGLIGLTNGPIYGLVALGYTLVYGILQLINFAHGDVFALSGLVASTMIVTVLGLDKDTSVARRHRRDAADARRDDGPVRGRERDDRVRRLPAAASAPRLAALITAVGMSFIVQNISLALYGVNFHSVPSFIPRSEAFAIGGISYSWNKLAVS